MAISIETLSAAKNYTEETMLGAGAIKGDKGDKGDPGTTYTPQIGTVRTVDTLTDAAASVTVDATNKKATFNFDIPQGRQGIQGPQGIQGIQGEKGDTYTPVIGDVLTVDSSSDASANIMLDEAIKKAIINLSLPRGINGEKGEKGDTGERGEQGLQGIQGLQGERGEQGPPGVQGVQGIQGIQGEKGNDGYPFLIYKQYEVGIEEFNEADYPEIGLMFMVHVWEDDKGYPVYRYTRDGTATPYTLVTYMNTEGIKGDKGDKGDQGEQGVPGVAGADGIDGITYTPEIGTVNTVESSAGASVTIEVKADEGRAIYNFDIPKGKDGVDGVVGRDGVDGVSPTVEIVTTDSGHTVKIADKDGVKSFDVNHGVNGTDGQNGTDGVDGQDGADGFSPVVTVTETDNGHAVSIEDKNGVKNFEVPNGKDAPLRIYASLSELELDTSATLKDITRKMAKGSVIAIKVDAMVDKSEYDNVTLGTVTIHKVEDSRIQAIMTEKQTGRTWVGMLDGNNVIVGWRELALKTYTTLAELGLTADATMMDVISAIPNGGDALLAVTDFTNWQTIFPYKEGNDQFGRVFIQKGNDNGRTYIKWFRKDGAREALGILSLNNNEFSGWNEIVKTYTTLAELGLTADATPSDVVRVMPAGNKALISTHEFTNYQTLFPYSVEADQYATLNVEKGYDTAGSRTIVTWVRKDASKIAYGGIDANNTIRWWNEVVLKGVGDIATTTVTTFTLPDTVVNQTNNSRITYQVKNGICCMAVQLALDAISSAVTTWTNVATGFPKPSFNISQTINSERNSSEVPMAMRITAGGTLQMIFNGTTNTMDWWTTTFTYPVAD